MNRPTLAGRTGAMAAWLSKTNSAVLVGVLAVVMAVVALQVRDHPQFSRVDEPQHYDYALKSPSAGVRIGEQYGLEAMRAVACRGIDLAGWAPGTPRLSECGDPLPDPTRSHSNGYNTAYLHTPAYYTATALVGEAVLWLPWVDSSLVAYRLVGSAWLAAGLLLVWYALGLVNLGVWGRAALVGLLGVSPVVVHASAFVNPDATAILGGALVLLALIKWETGKWPWWSMTAAAALSVWLKPTNASAAGVLAAYLMLRLWQERRNPLQDQLRQGDQFRPGTGQRAKAALSSILVTSASVLGWRLWQRHRRLDDEKDLPIHADERFGDFQWTSLDDQLRAVVTPFRDQWIPEGLPRSVLAPLGGLADLGLLVLLGVAVATTAAKSANRALVAAVFAAMAGMGAATMVSFHLALGRDSLAPGRYGLAILPFAAAAVAPAVSRHMLAKLVIAALACATAGAMLYGVIWHGPKPAIAVSPDSETSIGVWCSTTSASHSWRWNEVDGETVYHVSFDGWSWQAHEGTALSLSGQPADTEAVLYVQAGSADAWDSGPSGSRACRTAPAGEPRVTCTATATSFTWQWDPVEGATWYRIKSDPDHPWFEVDRLATTVHRAPAAGDVLFVQAGNPDGWNLEGTAEAACRP